MMLVYQALDLASEYYTESILIVNAQNEWRASESDNDKKERTVLLKSIVRRMQRGDRDVQYECEKK